MTNTVYLDMYPETEEPEPDDVIIGFDGEYAFLSSAFHIPVRAVLPNGRKKIYGSSGEMFLDMKRRASGGIAAVFRKSDCEKDAALMKQATRAKFRQHPKLRMMLEETGDALLLDDSDEFWGIKNNGTNRLGKILMELRDDCHMNKL